MLRPLFSLCAEKEKTNGLTANLTRSGYLPKQTDFNDSIVLRSSQEAYGNSGGVVKTHSSDRTICQRENNKLCAS